jgi:hypothetical protein
LLLLFCCGGVVEGGGVIGVWVWTPMLLKPALSVSRSFPDFYLIPVRGIPQTVASHLLHSVPWGNTREGLRGVRPVLNSGVSGPVHQLGHKATF